MEKTNQLLRDIDKHMRAEWYAGRLSAESWPKSLSDRLAASLLATVTGKSGSNDSPLLAGVSAPAAQAAPAAQSVANADGRFTKNPVTIDAIKWTGSNLREVIAFTDGPPDTRSIHAGMAWEAYVDLVARDGLKIYTLEGKMLANIGDWIIRGVKGEMYPCKDEIFRLTYEPVVARES